MPFACTLIHWFISLAKLDISMLHPKSSLRMLKILAILTGIEGFVNSVVLLWVPVWDDYSAAYCTLKQKEKMLKLKTTTIRIKIPIISSRSSNWP